MNAVAFLAGAEAEQAADRQGEAKLDHLVHQVEFLAHLPAGQVGLDAGHQGVA